MNVLYKILEFYVIERFTQYVYNVITIRWFELINKRKKRSHSYENMFHKVIEYNVDHKKRKFKKSLS